MVKIYLDAENEALGRLASYTAKQALLGNEIVVLNCEKAIISGNATNIIQKQKALRRLNTMKPRKGPFFSSDTEKILRRSIRGMLPDYTLGRGKQAWKRIKCYNGIPEEYAKEKLTKLKTRATIKNINLETLKKRL